MTGVRPALILVSLFIAVFARADVSITLRSAVRIDAGTALRIGDVASVSGDQSVGSLQLDADTVKPRAFHIYVEDIRRALESGGIGRSEVIVRGEACTVIVRAADRMAETAAEQPATTTVESTAAGLTIRSHIRAAIIRTLAVNDESLRLRFDQSDTEVLGRVTAGLTVDVHATGLSRKTPVRVTLYHPDGSIEVLRVRTGVQILRAVARVSRSMPRGTSVQPDDLTVSNEWLALDEPHLEPVAAIGQKLRRSVDAGDRLTNASVAPPVVIERGDIVMVHIVSGAVVLRQESRALESGRVGQRIRLEPMSGGRPFRAAIEGPGRAVIMTQPRISPEDV